MLEVTCERCRYFTISEKFQFFIWFYISCITTKLFGILTLHFDIIYRKIYYVRVSDIASIHAHPLYRRNYPVGIIICLYMYFYFIKNLVYLTYTDGYKVNCLIATKWVYVLRHKKIVTIRVSLQFLVNMQSQ